MSKDNVRERPTQSMVGRTVVITGASSGIGEAAARRLSQAGAEVIAVGRSPERTARIADELGTEPVIADFASLQDVKSTAATLLARLPRIDVLANNAGGIFGPKEQTVDGFEMTFQVNHLAPFLLTHLLMNRLVESKATVIQTSSTAARMGHIDLSDPGREQEYSPNDAYGSAKLANILFTSELQRRYGPTGINAVCFHPGFVSTGFASESEGFVKRFYTSWIGRRVMISPDRGADQLVWLASSVPQKDWTPGRYYHGGKVSDRVNAQASDRDLARNFWDLSERLLGENYTSGTSDESDATESKKSAGSSALGKT